MTARDITVNQLATQTFYQIPEIFCSRIQHGSDGSYMIMTSRYVTLSSDAKLAYGVLYKRCQLSINSYRNGKRDFVDENGSVFLIYTVKDLMLLLNKSKMTVTKIKKELQEAGLLREVRQGLNQPNRLYLQNVNAEEERTEYYDKNDTLIKTVDAFGNVIFQKDDQSEEVAKSLDNSGSPHYGRPKNGSLEVHNVDASKRDISERDNLYDTNRYKDDPPLSQLSDSEAFKMGQHGFLSDLTIQRLSLFGKEAKGLENKIYQAKRQVEKECHHLLGKQEIIYGEIWSQELEREVEKLIFKVKTGEQEGKPIQNLPGYFYKMMLRFWKMALLIEKEQGFIALSNQSNYAKQFPEECPSLIGYYYPDKLSEMQLNQYLTMLRMETPI